MRLKLTLCLLLANIVVFYALWRLDRPPVAPPSSSAIPPEMVRIDHIEIANRTSNESRILQRDASGNWRITQPVDWPANANAVQTIISQLQFLDQEASFPSADLAKSGYGLGNYSLDKPPLVMTLSAGTKKVELDFGAKTSIGSNFYMMNPADGMIRVVPQELLESINRPLADLRDSRIFSIPPFEIDGLSIHGTGQGVPTLVTLKKTVADWMLDDPRARANSDKVNNIVTLLTSLNVARFLPASEQDANRQGLANPFMSVELKGNTRQTLKLGDKVTVAPSPQYYAQLEGGNTVFTVDAAPFELLRNAQETLRETRFMKADIKDPANVTSLDIKFTNQDIRLQKLESGADQWQVITKDTSGSPVSADTMLVNSLIESLSKLEAISFASDAPPKDNAFGLDDPQRKVTIESGGKTFTLLIGMHTPADPGSPIRYYAKLDDEPFVYELSPSVIGLFPPDLLYYRNRTLESLPASAKIISLRLTDLSANTTIFDNAVDAQNTTLKDAMKADEPPLRDAKQTLMDALQKFRVNRYVKDTFSDNFQLDSLSPVIPWRYKLEVGVSMPSAAQTQPQTQNLVFFFSDRRGGSLQYGGTPQPPAIFELPTTVIGALSTLTIMQHPPANAEKIINESSQPINPRLPASPPSPAIPVPSPGN